MTEKKQRFTDDGFEAIEDQSFTDNHTGKTYYVDYFDEIVDLLNVLHEERNYFERKKEEFLSKWSIVHTENIQLKQENEQLKDALNQRTEQCDKYYKENEKLKKEIRCYKRYVELFG